MIDGNHLASWQRLPPTIDSLGGAGTLQEIAIAYQADIPVVVLRGSGGWADAFAAMPVDFRKKELLFNATTPDEAAKVARDLATK